MWIVQLALAGLTAHQPAKKSGAMMLECITIDVAWLPALTPPRHGRVLGSAILDRASAAAIGSVDRVSAR
jgi:hypothetical protein